MSTTGQEPATKIRNLRNRKETSSGFSSLNSVGKRVSNSVENHVSSVVENTETRFTRDRSKRKTSDFRKSTGPSSGHYSQSSKDKAKPQVLETNGNSVVSVKESKDNRNKVGKEKKDKGSKQDKVESPEFQLRVALDMCSKRGNVMSAIHLYDSARREGLKMGQYHYTVLLYLCSSAAVGVVKPAKSGNGSRTLNTLDSSTEVVNPMELGQLEDKGNSDFRNILLDNPVCTDKSHGTTNDMVSNSSQMSNSISKEKNMSHFSNGFMNQSTRLIDNPTYLKKEGRELLRTKDASSNQEDGKILVSKDIKKYALRRGFEIYENMCLDKVPMNEAALTSVARMAMSMGDGDMAFEMVKQMKPLGINPRLRSYAPALSSFCNSGDVDKAYAVEKHMLEHGVYPEEPELEALLRVSVGAGRADKVYYLLHKLRSTVRKVSPTTADLIIGWFKSKEASRVGKRKWDQTFIKGAIENNGGGWHGHGWLGKGKWRVLCTTVGADGMCNSCGVHLTTIDLDPIETENFAESVASIAMKREKKSSFQKFQKWLDYYGPFEAVVDGANVGLFSQRRFKPSKINAVVNGIRQKLPSKKWPLIVLHNKRITGHKMDEPINSAIVEKWKNADALYLTPTGSNDDWYWLYAAIKFKCLLVTNDEMRDHTFQLLGNDFFPKWKERHQVHFSFSGAGPEFHMPPPCSVVIQQESVGGHWHIPVESEHEFESERTWLCITRANSCMARHDSEPTFEESKPPGNEQPAKFAIRSEATKKSQHLNHGKSKEMRDTPQEIYKNLREIISASALSDNGMLSKIEAAELHGGCTIDFQI
ncbi:proteinaceous RNase P 1, chloroplastic/mitochondrial-like [Quillaja saponaria]|uniref:ribonuclease P n=1 Tax=Quillaja saponaria TaxID=32244 RepID=A0AAD7Q2Z7_QUISA|nr:proteinaceous RNase P 1, chloroplastic/mitochondrial-like [Quillaja saponaria]